MADAKIAGDAGISMPAEAQSAGRARPKQSTEQSLERLNRLSNTLAEKRKEAIEYRQESGIEQQWTEDQEFYEGIDDANRQDMAKGRDTKPPGQAYPANAESQSGSKLFPNITGPYCEAAAARVSDMLLPTDGSRGWSMKPSPVPDLQALAKGEVSPQLKQEAAALYPNNEQLAQQKLAAAVQQATQIMEAANAKAEKGEKRIDDWLVECQWHAEVRKVIEDAARLGSGVLKGPTPIKRKSVKLGQNGIEIDKKIVPASKRISCWDLYPAPGCGDSIHNGSFTFERDRLTQKKLQDLKGGAGPARYLDQQIDECLREGPLEAVPAASTEQAKKKDKALYEVWFFYGFLDRDDLEAAGCDCGDDEVPVSMPAIITVVNNRVIKAALNPADTGDFPYDVMPWRKKHGMPWGDGVARQIRTAQRIVTAALRAMMVNAGRAAGPMVLWAQGKVVPANGIYEISPWQILWVGEDGESVDDVRKAVGSIEFPMYQEQLQNIIQIGLKLAEDVTGLPLILQGQQGKAPDTVGGMTILNDNASSVLRRMARTFDDYVTEPHIRRYYVWLLQYGDPSEQGDFQVDARGSSALVERSLQNQELAQVVLASKDPIYGLDPKKAMREYLQSRKLDPKKFEYDDEEWKQIVTNMSKQGGDPRLAVAQLRAQLEEKLMVLDQQFEGQQRDKDRQLELVGKTFDQKLEQMRLSGERTINFDDIKRALAESVMELRQQREFFVADQAVQLRDSREQRTHEAGQQNAQRAHESRQGMADRVHDTHQQSAGRVHEQRQGSAQRVQETRQAGAQRDHDARREQQQRAFDAQQQEAGRRHEGQQRAADRGADRRSQQVEIQDRQRGRQHDMKKHTTPKPTPPMEPVGRAPAGKAYEK